MPILIGVSTCLLGEKVRHDGNHKKNELITHSLANYFKLISVCPEVEMGLGIPRPSMRIEKIAGDNHLLVTETRRDLTKNITEFSKTKVLDLKSLGISGYILKKNSPSCGLMKVKVYSKDTPVSNGIGFFAQELVKQFPHLPIEEEGRLENSELRENWLSRVFAYKRFSELLENFSSKNLIEFHTRHKLILLSKDPKTYSSLGQLIGKGKISKSGSENYFNQFMDAMKKNTSPGKHVNVLQHMMGYFKDHLDKKEKEELLYLMQDYKKGYIPLIAPITLMKHYIFKFNIEYLKNQYYLDPYPKELMA